MDRILERRFISDLKNCLKSGSEVRSILTEHGRLHTDLRLPQWRFAVSTKVVIETPSKDLAAYARYLGVKMWIDDLGED